MTFIPSLGKFRLPPGMSRSTVEISPPGAPRGAASTVYLQIADLPEDELLNTDRAEACSRAPIITCFIAARLMIF